MNFFQSFDLPAFGGKIETYSNLKNKKIVTTFLGDRFKKLSILI